MYELACKWCCEVLPYGVAVGWKLVASVCRPAVLAVAAVGSLGACSQADSGSTAATTTTATTPTTGSTAAIAPTTVPVAIELAETQVSASTVVAPETVGPCDPTQIEVVPVEPSAEADQVIDLVNRGSVRCEVDVSDSPDADEDLEPNVVLAPGELAHLWISEVTGCEVGSPSPPADFELRVNDTARAIPLTFAPQCGIELWAFFTD